jgi:predicted CXXCH cytochrome family protein
LQIVIKMGKRFGLVNLFKMQCFHRLLFLILLIGAANISHAQVEPPRNPNSAKSCAICHYRWVDTFFIEGRGSDLVDYTAEKMVATPEMCFSCHDGSIADSRARAYQTAQHKTNVPPPDHMKIPDIFPLGEQGNMECATCHTAHGVPSGPDSKETIFMRISNRNSAMCRMCHPEMADSSKFHNHPLDTVKQKIPRRLIEEHALEGDKTNQLICETCHAAHGAKYESFLIESGKDSSLCLACHADKNYRTPDGGKKPFHVINVKPTTASIPEALIKKGARVGYDGEIICQSCHKIHRNEIGAQQLLLQKEQQSALCLTCHTNKQVIAETKHNLSLTAPEEKNLAGETVAQAGVCSACHLPHREARRLEGEKQISQGLCLSCHSKGNNAEKAALSGTQHPLAVRPVKTNVNAITDLPLFNDHGFQDRDGEITCTTCHDPHRWRADSAAGGTGKDAPADRHTSFLRKQAPRICRECHGDKFPVVGSKHDLGKTAPEAKNIKNQTPAESGVCGTCHRVHNAPAYFLWARKPWADNGDVATDLCLGCHNSSGAAPKKVIREPSHPVNISPSAKGLTTTLPLFDAKGAVADDGVVSCATCHDPHRWDPLSKSEDDHFELDGNSRNSFLRLENSPSAMLCENCHAAQGFVDKTEHDLVVTVPSAKNIIGQTPLESGTCGVCHLTHNGRSDIVLWARGYGMGNNIMERICNTCHSPQGPAKTKVPPVYLHPREKILKITDPYKKGQPGYFPLFHGNTGERVMAGNISCPSCHNVHRWNPLSAAKGTGANTEGDADNSFLRPPAAFEVCQKCHGKDAPYKKKYYHDPTRRKFKGFDDMFFQ